MTSPDLPPDETAVPEAFASVPAVARFDEAVEQVLDRLRGSPAPDRLFYSLSALADFSLLWQLAAGLRTLGDPRGHRRFAVLAVGIAAESLAVNQGLKRLSRRNRPVHAIEHPFHVRTPSTTSFPSGHASSAFFAAVLLSAGRAREAPAWFALAALVAASRPYVGAHHPSDVVAGAAVGAGLGVGWLAMARRLGLWI
jgi:undecaprenyl-diphosphatase